jgi:Skp family chaperone for outer membrane proteins
VKSQVVALGVAAAAGLFCAGALLEPAHGVQNAPSPIYVINVKKVFDASPKFKQEAESLKAEMQKKEESLRALQTTIQAKTQQREKFKGQAERDAIEKEINDAQFQFAKLQRQFREELGKAESTMVAEVYRDMTTLLSEYCKKNRIYMVVRLDEPTAEMPQDMQVMTLMNRQVIYNHPNLDLTSVIAEGMKQGGAAAAPAGN